MRGVSKRSENIFCVARQTSIPLTNTMCLLPRFWDKAYEGSLKTLGEYLLRREADIYPPH